MKDVYIRNVPDDLHHQLVQAAKVEGMSMQQYLLWMITNMIGSEWALLEEMDDCQRALADERTKVYAIRAARIMVKE